MICPHLLTNKKSIRNRCTPTLTLVKIQERLHEGCEFPSVSCMSYKTLANRFITVRHNDMWKQCNGPNKQLLGNQSPAILLLPNDRQSTCKSPSQRGMPSTGPLSDESRLSSCTEMKSRLSMMRCRHGNPDLNVIVAINCSRRVGRINEDWDCIDEKLVHRCECAFVGGSTRGTRGLT